jgi:hypothetical protein
MSDVLPMSEWLRRIPQDAAARAGLNIEHLYGKLGVRDRVHATLNPRLAGNR